MSLPFPTTAVPFRIPGARDLSLLVHTPGAVDASRESDQVDAAAGGDSTGLHVWKGTSLLAAWLARSDVVRDAVVVELGCGTGAVGLAAYRLGARRVILTDSDRHSLHLAEINAERAGADNVTCAALRWGSDTPEELRGTANLVLGADVAYVTSAARSLVQTASELLCPAGGVLVIAHQLRFALCAGPDGAPTFEDHDDAYAALLEEADRRGLAFRLLGTAQVPAPGAGDGDLRLLAFARDASSLSSLGAWPA